MERDNDLLQEPATVPQTPPKSSLGFSKLSQLLTFFFLLQDRQDTSFFPQAVFHGFQTQFTLVSHFPSCSLFLSQEILLPKLLPSSLSSCLFSVNTLSRSPQPAHFPFPCFLFFFLPQAITKKTRSSVRNDMQPSNLQNHFLNILHIHVILLFSFQLTTVIPQWPILRRHMALK